jgi:hypothetical protein
MAKALVNDVTRAMLRQQVAEGMPVNEPMSAPAPSAEMCSPEVLQRDMALEYDSMVLLSELEQLAVRVSDHMTPASLAMALASLVDLANHAVEFVERLPMAKVREFSLEALVARDLPHYTHLRLQHVHEHRFSGAALGSTTPHADMFVAIGKDILRVLKTCLAINVKAFRSTDMRQQWSTVYSGFLVNLAKTLQKCHTNQRT